jgi:hypothetical protein
MKKDAMRRFERTDCTEKSAAKRKGDGWDEDLRSAKKLPMMKSRVREG